MKSGMDLICEERVRQITDEQYYADHDDSHKDGELSMAAVCYADLANALNAGAKLSEVSDLYLEAQPEGGPNWPWDDKSWKPSKDPVRNLVKAGALIAAEIDRLQRKSNDQADTRHG
jgi:hypothetical protein